MKLGSCCREKKLQFSSPTLRYLTNFYIELEQSCCSLSAVKACIWNIRPDNKLHVTGKFVFSHQKCYGPQSFYKLENSMSFNFCGSISIFGHVRAEFQPTNGGDRRKKCFLEISQFEQQIGISEYFSWKVHELSKNLSYQAPS